jgi:hypothetical protein
LLVSGNGFAQASLVKDDNALFAENVFHLSEIMLHDVANPPAASRFYAYSLLAAYEVAYGGNGKQADLNNLFKQKLQITGAAKPKQMLISFAAMYAMLDVGRQIMPSGYLLVKEEFLRVYLNQISVTPRKFQSRLWSMLKVMAIISLAPTDDILPANKREDGILHHPNIWEPLNLNGKQYDHSFWIRPLSLRQIRQRHSVPIRTAVSFCK